MAASQRVLPRFLVLRASRGSHAVWVLCSCPGLLLVVPPRRRASDRVKVYRVRLLRRSLPFVLSFCIYPAIRVHVTDAGPPVVMATERAAARTAPL
ncbi:hypothetical protein NDU88_002530 [Pleurodeles waltl]|uniref:Secreted protein n=1 Tax=Pleurodeles waltl TaxID=8319 RepID=A0AAV7TM37_PLEWA|nr:hypothetical protein NDU88_002530 [Pleurodeles waltl]